MKNLSITIYRKSLIFLGSIGLGKISLLKSLNEILFSHLKQDFMELDGHKLFLDKLDSLKLFRYGFFEEFETEIVKKIIKKGDIVLDVGANIGYFTLIFANLVGENGHVFAFEPEPTNFELLRKNITINGYKNVTLIKKALSDKTGKTKLFLSEVNLGDHVIIDTKENRNSVDIDIITGDAFLANLNQRITFIKMDIQGAEINALMGMASFLQSHDDIILMIEFEPRWLKRFGNNPLELLNLLQKYNFKLYEMDDKKKKLILSSSEELITKYSAEKDERINLLCSKSELSP